MKYPKLLMELFKIRIALFSMLSAMAGFMLAADRLDDGLLIVITGVFLLSCGACGLNQYQERDMDKLMERTKARPIPSGRINPAMALLISSALIFAGLSALLFGKNLIAAAMGVLAVFWYNVVYTSLKKKSAFASIPGSLTGAIPPAIGWVCGGGALLDRGLIALCLFFFMWQVPHSWLVQIANDDDCRKAGLPSLLAKFSRRQVLRIIFAWIFSTAVICLLIPLRGVAVSTAVRAALVVAGLWMVLKTAVLLSEKIDIAATSFIFSDSNKFMLAVMLLFFCDRLSLF